MSSKFYLIFQGQSYSRDISGYHSGDAISHSVARFFVPAVPFNTSFPAHQTTQRNFPEYLNLQLFTELLVWVGPLCSIYVTL
jgi:hypothetical protein